MLSTILFDLDNTLILFDEESYFHRYMELVQQDFSDLMPAEELGRKLLNATQSLMDNQGRMSNLDFFVRMFSPGLGEKGRLILERFDRFYESKYEQLHDLVTPLDGVRGILTEVEERGMEIVIASNPLLPLNIQEKRLRWAGLEDMEFSLITHIANMSYVKPQAGYYLEICSKIRKSPGECLMVGNDAVNDMAAAQIGMKTFLTTDSRAVDRSGLVMSRGLLEDKDMVICRPDFQGPLAEIFDVLDSFLCQ